LAPQVGLEPTTLRLTAECSAIELLRSVVLFNSFTKVAERKQDVKIFTRFGVPAARIIPSSMPFAARHKSQQRRTHPELALAVP